MVHGRLGGRWPVLRDASGVALAVVVYGLVFGVLARGAGFSLVEAIAFSVLVVAGASQFAAAGMLAAGVSRPVIVVTSALLNARHLLYGAALAPWFAGQSRRRRAVLAYLLNDESFALGLRRFTALGRVDVDGFVTGALVVVGAWWVGTALGFLGAASLPEPRTLGLDIVFPAAFAALATPLVRDRADLAAVLSGATAAIAGALVAGSAAGIVAGGLVGPLLGLLIGGSSPRPRPSENAGTTSTTNAPTLDREAGGA